MAADRRAEAMAELSLQRQPHPRISKRLSDFRSAPLPRIVSRAAQRRKEPPDSDDYDTDLECDHSSAPPAKRAGGGDGARGSQQVDVDMLDDSGDVVKVAAASRIRRPRPGVGASAPAHVEALNPAALSCSLLSTSSIVELNLGDSRIGFCGAKEVIAALTINTSVTRVDLSNNALGGTGVSALLGKLLQTNSCIRKLNLSHNDFQDEDMRYLSCGLESNLSLVRLDLGHNCIGEEGAKCLAAALTANDALEDLDLSWNKVRKSGAIALGNAVKHNGSLERLNLAWNGLAYEGTLALRDVLQVNRQLAELDISSNRINWDGAGLLADALRTNCYLAKLFVGDNPLTTTGALDIVKSIADNAESALVLLDMKGVPVVRQFDVVCEEIRTMRPKFKGVHGGIVQLHDIIGERKVRRVHPMQKILDYMYEREMRPIELMRSFDKEGKCMLTADQFIQRLKSVGIDLRVWEMEELKDFITAQGGQPGSYINYKKLIESITQQIETERSHRIAERERTKRAQKRNDSLLGSSRYAALDSAGIDRAVAQLTGVEPSAVGSVAGFAHRVVSDSISERHRRSFEAKMATASSIRDADVNKHHLLQSGSGGDSIVRPVAAAAAAATAASATTLLPNGRRLWMTAALDSVYVRGLHDDPTQRRPPVATAASGTARK